MRRINRVLATTVLLGAILNPSPTHAQAGGPQPQARPDQPADEPEHADFAPSDDPAWVSDFVEEFADTQGLELDAETRAALLDTMMNRLSPEERKVLFDGSSGPGKSVASHLADVAATPIKGVAEEIWNAPHHRSDQSDSSQAVVELPERPTDTARLSRDESEITVRFIDAEGRKGSIVPASLAPSKLGVANPEWAIGDARMRVQAPDGNSVQYVFLLTSRAAPHRFRFQVNPPEGTVPAQRADGSIEFRYQTAEIFDTDLIDGQTEVVRNTQLAGSIAAPWAYDDAGEAVPVSQTLADGILLVDIAEASSYPIVADPEFNLTCTFRSRNDSTSDYTRTQACPHLRSFDYAHGYRPVRSTTPIQTVTAAPTWLRMGVPGLPDLAML